jgi:hypothetical protein
MAEATSGTLTVLILTDAEADVLADLITDVLTPVTSATIEAYEADADLAAIAAALIN